MEQISNTAAKLAMRLSNAPFVESPFTDRPATSSVMLLTQGLSVGDEESFRQFHALYFSKLYRFLLAVTKGDEQQAADALQETLLRILRHARPFSDEEVFWCWIKAVARSAARDLGRKHGRYLALLRRFAFGFRAPATAADDYEKRMGAILEESLGELDAADRRLLEEKYVDGNTMRELSSVAGITEKAIESRLLRLRRELRRRILEKLRKS